MSACLFCEIASGQRPAELVASTDQAVAFRDLNPQAPVHLLVVPKRHLDSAAALSMGDAELLADLFSLAVSVASEEDLAEGWRLVTNVGPAAGQSVNHLHFHLLGGRQMGWPPG